MLRHHLMSCPSHNFNIFMLVLAHAAIGVIFVQIFISFQQWNEYPHFELIAAIGALLSDLFDKPLYWGKLCHATRSYAHTLVFSVLLYIASWILFRDGKLSCILFVSVLSHLFADLFFGYVPLFYPFQSFKYPSMIHTRNTKKILKILELLGLIYLVLFSNIFRSLKSIVVQVLQI